VKGRSIIVELVDLPTFRLADHRLTSSAVYCAWPVVPIKPFSEQRAINVGAAGGIKRRRSERREAEIAGGRDTTPRPYEIFNVGGRRTVGLSEMTSNVSVRINRSMARDVKLWGSITLMSEVEYDVVRTHMRLKPEMDGSRA